MGDQAATTRRAGDLIVYRFACHDAESMIAIARSGEDQALIAGLLAGARCGLYPGSIAARLEDWIAGPFAAGDGVGGSVWRVADQFGDTEFVWINDLGGRHAARREMSL